MEGRLLRDRVLLQGPPSHHLRQGGPRLLGCRLAAHPAGNHHPRIERRADHRPALNEPLDLVVGQLALIPLQMTAELALVSLVLTLSMCLISAVLAVRRVITADPAEVF